MLRAIAISGYKGGGKTSAIENLVEELTDRGYRVGTIKHVPREDFTLDQPETDTWRHARAGSEKVIALSPEEVATLEKRGAELENLLLGIEDLDFVILEGFKSSENVARIVVSRDGEEAKDLEDEYTVGFVGEGKGEKPVLDPEDSSALADFVEEKAIMPVGGLDCGECGFGTCRDYVLAAIDGDAPKEGCVALKGSVSLSVDGKRVPLKPFVQDLIAKTLLGMLSSLKEGEGRKIELEVKRNEG